MLYLLKLRVVPFDIHSHYIDIIAYLGEQDRRTRRASAPFNWMVNNMGQVHATTERTQYTLYESSCLELRAVSDIYIVHWIPRFAKVNVNKVNCSRNRINSTCMLFLSMYTAQNELNEGTDWHTNKHTNKQTDEVRSQSRDHLKLVDKFLLKQHRHRNSSSQTKLIPGSSCSVWVV